MGIETALLIGTGMAVGGMVETIDNANKQAKALKSEAALKMSERAKEGTALAASQKVSFLSSGIALDGDINSTPTSVMSDTYTKARKDVDTIGSNYTTQVKNVFSAARTQLLKQMASLAMQGGQGTQGMGIM